eukprot:15242244-Alexandrium_andersonii.AAC.1
MAAKGHPGGGVRKGAGPQEENLHRRSDAVRFLEQQDWEAKLYPIPDEGCLLSKEVMVFRGPEENGYPFLDRPFRISMISCTAISRPRLDEERRCASKEDHDLMKAKVEAIVRTAVE